MKKNIYMRIYIDIYRGRQGSSGVVGVVIVRGRQGRQLEIARVVRGRQPNLDNQRNHLCLCCVYGNVS